MKKGTVRWVDDKKGYLFITGEDGVDVFIHHDEIFADGRKKIIEGQQVEYEIEEFEDLNKAANITVNLK